MTDDTAPPTPEDDGILAAEYVLGLLDHAAMTEAEARIARDPAFAAQVRRWQEDLAPLAQDLDAVPPSPAAKDALMARLFDDGRRADAARSEGGFLARWRWGFATALAAVVLVAALLFYPVPDPGPSYVAELQPETRDFALTAALILGDSPQLDLMRTEGAPAPEGRSTELWAIPLDGVPVSLGVVPEAENWSVALNPDLAGQAAGLTLALSDEPEGGSPTGVPTGLVLATSPLDAL